MLSEVTWPVAFAIVASVLAITGGIIKMVKNEFSSRRISGNELTDLRELIQDAKSKIGVFETQIEELKKHDTELKENLVRDSRACLESFNKLELKLEKVTDLMIEIIKTK